MGKKVNKVIQAKLLKELYLSINRMHEHMVYGRNQAAQAERWHQRALRRDFERLDK